jgi:outer membrane protein OmpA-like peptidoglycan-associated protein
MDGLVRLANFARAGALGCLALAAGLNSASAQDYAGDEVIVNPQSGPRALLTPDGSSVRLVQPLLQPGETDPNAPIHLHMPRRHRAVHPKIARKSSPKTEVATPRNLPTPEEMAPFSALPPESAATLVPSLAPAPAKPPARKPTASAAKPPPLKAQAKATPPPASAAATTFLSGAQAKPAPTPAITQRMAATPPSEAETGLSRQSSILFAPGAAEPAPSALDTVREMSGALASQLAGGSARIQLEAYGGKKDDKSSDARRLSLKRALIVRQLLIDDGVPSERIDVRAMGGASDGPLDRVDIYVRA